MLRATIIDDEAKARKIIASILKEYCPEVEVVGMAQDVPSAVELINTTSPDLVFLDIEMPGKTGLQLLEEFEEVNFGVIFTTAYDEYAVKAFRVSAIDYLLKPIQITELIKAVNKFKASQKRHSKEQVSNLKSNIASKTEIQKIALPVSDGLLFVEVQNILYLKAEGSYTHVILNEGNKLLVSKKLKEIEDLLPDFFFRSHRSFSANLHYIKQFVRKDGGYLIMTNGDMVNISAANKESFLDLWKSIGR